MLSKVNPNNTFLGTQKLIDFYNIKKFDIGQDNLNNMIIYKKNNKIYVHNYKINKTYNHDKIQIEILNEKFIKHIDSFDQNNIFISDKIRNTVLLFTKNQKYNNILGIGGEFYVYFKFIHSQKYYGISNHQSIINDANYNIPFSNNYLVNYDNITHNFQDINLIILNVFNITNNIIKYIKTIVFNNIIIISCNLTDNKLKEINNKFKIINIKHIKNFNSWIWILYCKNKI
jgi:hypothetical protein